MEQLQEMFGPLVENQLSMMDWAPSKREAEQDSAPSDRSKAQRTEQGKGRTESRAHWRRAGGKGRRADGPRQTNMIKALARLALQQETALNYSGPLPLLFAAAQKWKKTLEGGRTTAALRTTLFGCLIQMLHTGLTDIGSEESTHSKRRQRI